jgi:PAS domain S-box-containing protein
MGLKHSNDLARKVALIYVVVAGTWILLSDELLKALVSNPSEHANLSIIKGLGFVLVTGGLLHQILQRWLRRWEREMEQRKQAEAGQKDADERYRQLFAVQSDAVLLMDYQTNQILEVNPAAEKMYGYSHNEFLRLTATEVSHEEIKPGPTAATEVKHVPLRMHRRKDGSVFPVEIFYSDFTYQNREIHVASIRDITERQQIEAALLKSKQRYHDLFEHMNEGFAYCQMIFEAGQPKDFVYLAVNPAFSRLTGLKEVVGRRVTEVIPGLRASDPDLLEIYGQVVTTGKPEKFERFVTSLGQWFDVSVYGIDQDYFVAVFDVITERKRVEAALRAAEQFSKSTIDALAAHLCVLDETGVILATNTAWNNFAAANPPLAQRAKVGANYLAVCAAVTGPEVAEAAAFAAGIRSVIRGERDFFSMEYACHSPTEQRWFLGHVTRFQGTDAPRVVVVHENITDRKRAEAELVWKTAFLEAQVNSALDGILVVDSQGRQILRNQRLNELWKYPRLLIDTGDNAAQIQFAASRTKNPREFAEKIAHLYAHPDEVSRDEIELVDGTILDRYSSPVRDQAGNHYGRIWTFRDITESRKLAAELRQSQKMDAIGHLASGVAHDFNNVLAVIELQAGLLKAESSLTPKQADYAAEIEKATEHAAELTRQLLLFSREQPLQLCDLDLNVVGGNLSRMLRRIVGEDVELKFAFSPSPLWIHADAGTLDQILLNLTVNARDAMPAGGRLVVETSAVEFDDVTASQFARARPGSFVCISVSDTGCGIPPEIMPRIFEPFFTTKKPGQGTGLGLATVWGIVEKQHGWINVYSEPGQGTAFRIYLPRLTQTPDKKASWSSLAAVVDGKETILLVEDDVSLRAALRISLMRHGYRVLEAPTGVSALEVWRQHREEIQLLLTDMVMPEGVNGKELAQRLLAENPRLKVIYASGYCADLAGKDLVLQEGVNFLTKPFETQKLLKTVRHSLDNI